MPRIYTVPFENIAVTAVQDLFELSPADDLPIAIIGGMLSQSTDFGDAEEEGLRLQFIRGHTTSGSGGASVTPTPNDPNDPAAGFAAERNNTTIASAGTTVGLPASTWNIRGPWVFAPTDQEVIRADQGDTTIVLRLLAAPTDSVSVSGYLTVSEG